MAAITGKAGSIKLSTNTVMDIDTWSLDVSREVKESTSFADGAVPWKSYVAGLNGASGKLSGNLNMGDTNGQLALWTSLTSDTALTADLYLDDTHFFAVSILVTKFSPKAPVGDIETVEYDFTVTGAPSYT